MTTVEGDDVSEPMRPSDPLREADVRRGVRILLQQPLLHADRHHDELALVRRYQHDLATIFADGLGYRLLVEPGLARLYKTGLDHDGIRGLSRRNGTPFDPRRYLMLALVLAALTQSRRQVMVDELVAAVRSSAVDADIDVDLDNLHERRALHSALMALIDLGVISERDGDLEHWAERHTESLLDVHRDRLGVIVAAPLGSFATPDEATATSAAPSAAGGARIAVRRLLVERPVLTLSDLTQEQQGWWRRNREREREWFRRTTGLELELRAEGALAVDPDDTLSDIVFPAAGSTKQFALLLLAGLVETARTGSDLPQAPTWARLAASTAKATGDQVFAAWRTGLRKSYRERPDDAYTDAIDLLIAMGLVRIEDGAVLVHAAAARYAPRPELVTSRGPSGETSLFEEDS